MLFNSVSFLIFFPIVIGVYFVMPDKTKNIWLLLASYYFYMSWNAKYGLLILLSTVITYICGLLVGGAKRTAGKKAALAVCILSNLGILVFFKYFAWILENISAIIGQTVEMPFSILLPVGISFYTFQALGYVIDVYRDDIAPERNFITYALYVSFFPQLVAGPIERSTNLLKQLEKPTRFHADNATKGLQIMLWGYVEKMVIADNLAIVVDQIYGNWHDYGGGMLLLASVLFTIQIYCDFGGYSHIAIGAAKVLNVTLMDNFRQPYFASSIKEHWRRWHISMSGWFRDYLYIPLGGSRCSNIRKNLNVLITFFVSGLWHGASWHYVVWGGMHGFYQVIGESLRPLRIRICRALRLNYEGIFLKTWQRVGTFFLIVLTFVVFRADNMSEAMNIMGKIFGQFQIAQFWDGTLGNLGFYTGQVLLVAVAMVLLLIVDILHEKGVHLSKWIAGRHVAVRWAVYYVLLLMILLSVLQTFGKSAASFLYFQF